MRALSYPSGRRARPYKADLRSGVSAGDRSLGARDDCALLDTTKVKFQNVMKRSAVEQAEYLRKHEARSN